jgi:TonB family protein
MKTLLVALGTALLIGTTAAQESPASAAALAPAPKASFDPSACGGPEYPIEAVRHEWTGIVRLRFHVSSTGEVTGADILRSTGHPLLDETALQALRRCRFTPATVDGAPVESSATVEYVWKLDESPWRRVVLPPGRHFERSDISAVTLVGHTVVTPGLHGYILGDLQRKAMASAHRANLEAARVEAAVPSGGVSLPATKDTSLRDLREMWVLRQCNHELSYIITLRMRGPDLVQHWAVLHEVRRPGEP